MINWTLLTHALSFYKENNYNYIEVPWTVPEYCIDITLPKEKQKYKVGDMYVVGSAEQSFFLLRDQGKLDLNKKYVALTPCFRDEDIHDDLTRPYFMKVELFSWVGKNLNATMINFVMDATKLFKSIGLDIDLYDTEEGVDIYCKNIELGSYGLRYLKGDITCVYGTGCAEPRTSYCMEYA